MHPERFRRSVGHRIFILNEVRGQGLSLRSEIGELIQNFERSYLSNGEELESDSTISKQEI